MNPKAIAESIALELAGQGAQAVVLMGSHARGDAHPHSDIDLIALGSGPEYRLERRHGHLIAISWTTSDDVRRAFTSPNDAGASVQGWRDGRPLFDPEGLATALRERARAWNWQVVGDAACDAYVAEELTGLAEEVHKLVNLLDASHVRGAAVQRNFLSFRLGAIMAVHLRLLYGTENDLWDLVCAGLDQRWRSAQDAAFGLAGESFGETCEATHELYRLACANAQPLFDARQVAVTETAGALRSRSGHSA